MNAKMKSCFTPHALIHSLFGLGLGLFLASIIPSLSMWWLGVVVIVIAFAMDAMRKE